MTESVPDGWLTTTLDAVCDKITDGTHRSPPMTPEGFLYVTSKNVRPFRLDLGERLYVSEEDHKEIWTRCDVRFGDILLTKDGANTGNAAINPLTEPFSLLSSVGLIRPNPRVLDAGFLCQCLNSESGRKQTTAAMEGLAIRRLTIQKIRALKIPLPPLPEQRKIAAILSSIDEVIERTTDVVDHLTHLLPTMTHEFLTRGLPGRHGVFQMTPRGVLPATWQARPTGEALKKLPVGARYDAKTRKKIGSVQIIDQSTDGVFGYHDDEPGINASASDPVVTFANHTCAVRWMETPFSVIQNVFPLRGISGVTTRFLYYVLRGRVPMMGYKGHWPDLMETYSPVPPENEQFEITDTLDSIGARLVAEKSEHAALADLKRALLVSLFSGTLRVGPDGATA